MASARRCAAAASVTCPSSASVSARPSNNWATTDALDRARPRRSRRRERCDPSPRRTASFDRASRRDQLHIGHDSCIPSRRPSRKGPERQPVPGQCFVVIRRSSTSSRCSSGGPRLPCSRGRRASCGGRAPRSCERVPRRTSRRSSARCRGSSTCACDSSSPPERSSAEIACDGTKGTPSPFSW